MLNVRISGFADEISPDLNKQIAVLNALDIRYMELRSVDKINIADFTLDFAKEVKTKLDANGISVSAIGSPIGKIKLSEDFDAHFEKFKHVVELAKLFGTRYIRIFSFYMEDGDDIDSKFDEVVSKLGKLVAYAKEQDVVLIHENEKKIFGDSPERCARLFDSLYCESFKCTFDPANFVQCGADTLNAYGLLEKYLHYMHIKDARYSDSIVVPPGTGDGNVKEILKRLSAKGYSGFLSLEPHLKVFEGLAALENGKNESVNENSTFDGPSAYKHAFESLVKILPIS